MAQQFCRKCGIFSPVNTLVCFPDYADGSETENVHDSSEIWGKSF
jgi:hypothetical protein